MFEMLLCRRKEPIIAIGGGVCLDVCGLAANLYRRNTPVIKVIKPNYFVSAWWCVVRAGHLTSCNASFIWTLLSLVPGIYQQHSGRATHTCLLLNLQ